MLFSHEREGIYQLLLKPTKDLHEPAPPGTPLDPKYRQAWAAYLEKLGFELTEQPKLEKLEPIFDSSNTQPITAKHVATSQ